MEFKDTYPIDELDNCIRLSLRQCEIIRSYRDYAGRILDAILINRYFRLRKRPVLKTVVTRTPNSSYGVLPFLRFRVKLLLFLFRKKKTEKLWKRKIVQHVEGILCFLRKPGEHQIEKGYYYEPIVAITLADLVFAGPN